MAITSGVGPHSAWLVVDGTRLLLSSGIVTQSAQSKTATFRCALPLSLPGAYSTLTGLGDNHATIEVMTRGVTKTLLTGEVDLVDYDYIGRMIRVEGRDKSAKLHDERSAEKWQNKTTVEIVKELAGRVGLKVDAKALSTVAGKMLEADHVKLTDGVSYSHVIQKLAELDGARWWVDGDGTLHYQPYGSSIGTYSIFIDQSRQPIRSDALHLRLHHDLQAAKDLEVEFKAWHPRKKQTFKYRSQMLGRGGPKRFEYVVPSLQADQVEQYAKSFIAERARRELTVSATVVGDPTVSAGMSLALTGTNTFDQVYDIDTVHHEFGMRGHTTHITARAARKGRTPS